MGITFMEGLLHAQIYEIGVLLNRNSTVCCHSYGIFEPNSQLPGWAASTAAVTITALSSQENSLKDFNGDDKQTTLWRLAQKSCPRIGWRRRGRGWL